MKIQQPPVSKISELTIDADLDFLSTYQVKALAAPASTESLRKGSKDVTNAEVADAAAISLSKIATALGITDADIAADAEVAWTKIDSALAITNADIAPNAAIAQSKLALTSLPTIVPKTADETVNNSTTLQNDDELLFAVAANEVWEFYSIVRITTGLTPDWKGTFVVPTGGALKYFTSPLLGDSGGQLSLNLLAAAATFTIAGAITDKWAAMWGIYVGGANAGNVQFQWAQNGADASDTKVLTNSFIIAHKLS